MHRYFIAAGIMLGAASLARAQSAAAPTSAAAAPTPARSIFQPPLTLASCTVTEDTNRFTLTNPKSTPVWYRSAGSTLLRSGQRVQIVGRLIPTPNIAAQAGSLDSVVPLMAWTSRESRVVAVPMPRASTFRLLPEPAATTAECVTR